MVDTTGGVGVLDRAVAILAALEAGPASLADLVARTGLARPTTYRLAVALEAHRLVARDADGRFGIGARCGQLAVAAGDELLRRSGPVLAALRDQTGESAQLYRREGQERRCVAAAERAAGLRDTVPVGALLPLTAGSAAQVLLAWTSAEPLRGSAFGVRVLSEVRRRGWAASVAERESGVASVSAPVRDGDGEVVAAVSVSGPVDRLTRSPGRLHAPAVLAAAAELEHANGGGAPPHPRGRRRPA